MGKAQGGGSGWVILTYSPRDKRLVNAWAADHTTTLAGGEPILVLDMYEHAYQMDFGAAAAKYIDAFFANIQWDEVNRRYERALAASHAIRDLDPHQAQRWAEDDVDLDRDERDVADVLLADEQRSPTSSEHEQYLLEARVEVAQEDEARRVLAVAVDDDLIDVDRREQGFDSLLELGGGDDRQRLRDVEWRHPYVSQVDRSRHGCSFNRVAILTPDSPRRTVGRQVR